MFFIRETAIPADTVDVSFDNAHLFIVLSDGRAIEFPLDWFSLLEAATADERRHFAISLDRQQLCCSRAFRSESYRSSAQVRIRHKLVALMHQQ